MNLKQFEQSPEIMAFFILRKLILQTRMRSHSVGLDVWFSVGSFVYFHTLCVRTAKALGDYFAGRLGDKYHNLMNWLICQMRKTHYLKLYILSA